MIYSFNIITGTCRFIIMKKETELL